MKYLKTFEDIGKPQLGDYVIVNPSSTGYDELKKYLKSHIGQITNIDNNIYPYEVQFENIPENIIRLIAGDKLIVARTEIEHFSSNKEDLMPFINANKFNV